MDWYQWLCLFGVPSIISGIFALVITRSLNKRDKAAEERAAEAATKAEETAKQAKEANDKSEAIALGVQALLRDRLLQGYRHYEEKGWADYDDRDNLENVWKQYHALGANGIMDSYRQRFLALPVFKRNQTEEE